MARSPRVVRKILLPNVDEREFELQTRRLFALLPKISPISCLEEFHTCLQIKAAPGPFPKRNDQIDCLHLMRH